MEGALLLAAFFLGWLMDFRPTQDLRLDWTDFGYGLLATVPMLLILAAALLYSGSGIRQLCEFVRDTLGPFLSRCHTVDLLLLAILNSEMRTCWDLSAKKPIRSFPNPFDVWPHTENRRSTAAFVPGSSTRTRPKHASASDLDPCEPGPWLRVLSTVEM